MCAISTESLGFGALAGNITDYTVHTFHDIITKYSTVQHSTAHHSTSQHSSAQHSTAQHSTSQYITSQHSTAQHNTAQHSTSHHSTAQHNTVQQSTVSVDHLLQATSAGLPLKRMSTHSQHKP